jgi:hypothetical protein
MKIGLNMRIDDFRYQLLACLICASVACAGQAPEGALDTLTNSGKDAVKNYESTLHESGSQIRGKANEVTGTKVDPANVSKKAVDAVSGNLPDSDEVIRNLQYDSDNPENAPWEKSGFSGDGLNKLKGSVVPSDQDLKMKGGDLQNDIPKLKTPTPDAETVKKEIEKVSAAIRDQKLNKNARAFDSLNSLKTRLEDLNLQQELLGAKRIYSHKYIQKLYDSLGLKKADSVFQVAKRFSRTEVPKEDLLNRLNTDINEKSEAAGIDYDKKTGAPKGDDFEKLNALPDEYDKLKEGGAGVLKGKDIADLKLAGEELVDLPPLRSLQVDTENMPVIDSMRKVAMKAKNIRLDENRLTDEIKRSSFKKNLSFLDKSYFEGILGVIDDTTFTIVQISPSLGYHLTKTFSIGLGPVLSLEYQHRKVNAVVGFRSFIKNEFWKQRAYLQFEDNARPSLNGIESIRTLQHSLLAGGGGLLPISDKLAINIGIFYRVNQDQVQFGGSPWVFRIGLSTVKEIGKIK